VASKFSKQNKRVGIVLTSLSLSGGTSIIFDKLENVSNNFEMTILLPSAGALKHGNDFAADIKKLGLKIAFLNEDMQEFDLVICTFWATVPLVLRSGLRAKKFLFFCQSIEDRFYSDPKAPLLSEVNRAQVVYGLDIPTITEASWIKRTLELRPGQPEKVALSFNPILLEQIAPKPIAAYRGVSNNKLVIVIEGHEAWFKGVQGALSAVRLVRDVDLEVHVVGAMVKVKRMPGNIKLVNHKKLTRYEFQKLLASSDVLIKNSQVEGMYGPPLESFSLGTTCITSSVTGHEEFVRHLDNALVVDIDDVYCISKWVRSLHNDRDLLERLSSNAKKTAAVWASKPDKQLFWKNSLSHISERSVYQTLESYLKSRENPWASIVSRGEDFNVSEPKLRDYFKYAWHLLFTGQFVTLLQKTYRYLREL
jgi:O-antigen biosynthesis protein